NALPRARQHRPGLWANVSGSCFAAAAPGRSRARCDLLAGRARVAELSPVPPGARQLLSLQLRPSAPAGCPRRRHRVLAATPDISAAAANRLEPPAHRPALGEFPPGRSDAL